MRLKAIFSLFILFIVTSIDVSAQTVYATNTGKKYHIESCRYLNKSKISTSLTDAKSDGLTACKVCKTSTKGTFLSNNSTVEIKETTANRIKNNSSSQCTGKTKAGSRCKRKTTKVSGKCYQHE